MNTKSAYMPLPAYTRAYEPSGAHTAAAPAQPGPAPVPGTIPIFFTIDDGYAPWLAVALRSLLLHADPARHYTIVVLHEPLTPEHRAKLEAIAAGFPNAELRFVAMDGKIEGIHDRMGNRLRADYFTLTIFFRLFIPEMFPEWDKGIYLDADIVVPGDISQLFDTDLGGNLIGACRDSSITGIPGLVKFTDEGAGVGIENYINSGVLLMNMKALREVHLERRFLQLLHTYHFDCVAPDQDYLNVLCHGKIFYLGPEWDAMPEEGKPEMPCPKLIHYNLFMKPWCYDEIPYRSYFWRHVPGTGFEQEIRAFKESYPPEQKAKDEACLRRLEARGEQIAAQPGNFASVFNTGKEARL